MYGSNDCIRYIPSLKLGKENLIKMNGHQSYFV